MQSRAACTPGLVLIAILLVSFPLWPTEAPDQGPRVGLALSGGGALGSAHVGVLKVLEELNIPVHFVAGTSMGAIVGGLYAAGISPDEMEGILGDVDWRALLDDRPNRRDIPYRRKVDDQTFLARFEIGFNGGSFQLPSGLITGQQLGFALQALALRTAAIDDFDTLPIPFRAIATDITTGEMVVLGRGDLGHAIRASMSIPGVFSPVEIDGRLLVDGSFSRNLPVDVVRAMGADVVIAVDVGQPMPETAELFSITKMTGQVVGLKIRENVREQAALADVLIEPELEGFAGMAFERALEMIPPGVQAAREMKDELTPLAVSEAAFDAYIGRVREPLPPPSSIASVQLTDSSTADSEFLFRKVRTRPGDPFDLRAIQTDLRRLYETGDYERVDFFLTRDDDEFALHIETHEKPWGPDYLRFGLNLIADFEGESSFDILASYTMTRINSLRGEIKINTQLGENPAVFGEFYQPLSTAQTWFVAPWASLATATSYTPVDETVVARYRSRQLQAGVDLGLQLGKYGELRLGVFHSSGEATLQRQGALDTLQEPPAKVDFDGGGYRVSAFIDQFDNMNFPRDGYFGMLGCYGGRDSLGSETDFDQALAFLGAAVSHERHSAMALVNLHSALGSSSPLLANLGGLFSLSGYEPGSIVGSYGGNVSLLYLYRLARLPPGFGDGIYIGASVEAGNLWAESSQVTTSDLLYSGSLCIGVDTALGPLYLAQGFTEDGAKALYLYIGRAF